MKGVDKKIDVNICPKCYSPMILVKVEILNVKKKENNFTLKCVVCGYKEKIYNKGR